MRLQDMIGLAVFEVEGGKQVGKVLDVMLNEDWTISGITLEGKTMFSTSSKVVLWEDIVAYGEDAVMIRNQQAVRKCGAENIQLTFISGNGKLMELPVLTEDGTMIGTVADVYFEQNLGNTITGIEISDGFISDLMEGRKILPLTPGITKGENAIMVPPNSEQRLEKTMNSING
ncbi:PRC-barrel domain-containing protein [Paenibacillus woosongensis]|uniref:PRC-barrel domain-containing protein n=1 Tax=Paenibacillus woosongensis TaxID=307580 RepID=A0AA95I7G8_9BACL|nr:PRC-barrel domain-containing protein [Paenibacillus woosongensis]WHX48017.1 PRC-barrel domain-containing protein [Paenibacillus woosongensis]